MIGFVTCRLTLKIIGIGAAECSWGDVKKIKYDEISATRSDVSEKHSIVYISDCNELGRIAWSKFYFIIYERYPRHVFDDDDFFISTW